MKLFACICVVFLLQSILSCGQGLNCDSLPMPKSYVVYFLQNGEKINIDGKLDDNAWQEVSRSDRFIGKYAYRITGTQLSSPPHRPGRDREGCRVVVLQLAFTARFLRTF